MTSGTGLRLLSFALIVSVAWPGLRFPFLGPGKPIPGFNYKPSPGEYADYRVLIRYGETIESSTYRLAFLSQRAEKKSTIFTFEHSEIFPREPQTVAQFEIGKREWEFFLSNPAKHPVAPLKITLQKNAEEHTVISSDPGLTVFGRKLGFGFHFLENFSAAVKDVKPGDPQPVSFGSPPHKVSAFPYKLNYKTEDFYEGELPRRVEASISGTMLASDEVPFGIVRLEITKAVKRTFEVVGVKAPPETVHLQITLTLESVGKGAVSRLIPPAPPKTEEKPSSRPGPDQDRP